MQLISQWSLLRLGSSTFPSFLRLAKTGLSYLHKTLSFSHYLCHLQEPPLPETGILCSQTSWHCVKNSHSLPERTNWRGRRQKFLILCCCCENADRDFVVNVEGLGLLICSEFCCALVQGKMSWCWYNWEKFELLSLWGLLSIQSYSFSM